MKTVSLELAKELKEAGYPQEPLSAYWYKNKEASYLNRTTEMNYSINLFPGKVPDWSDYKEDEYFASPTADEILDQLPWQVKDGMDRGRLVVEKSFFDKKWKVTYVDYSGGRFAQSNQDENIANSAAKMWLYLKKEKLI